MDVSHCFSPVGVALSSSIVALSSTNVDPICFLRIHRKSYFPRGRWRKQSEGILEDSKVIYEELRDSWHPVNALLSSLILFIYSYIFLFFFFFIHFLVPFTSDGYNQLGSNAKRRISLVGKKSRKLFKSVLSTITKCRFEAPMFEFKPGFYDIIQLA